MTHVSEWTPSVRETDCRQRLLPAEAEWTRILQERQWEKEEVRIRYWDYCTYSAILWHELLIQQALPSFLSSNPHGSCTVTWQNKTRNAVSRETFDFRCFVPILLALTYWRHCTDAECRSCGWEAELIQYCVGPCWINHCNFTAGGRTRNYPHRTLTEKDEHGVLKEECHENKSQGSVSYGWMALYVVISLWLQLLFNQNNDRLTVASPEISGVTATAQFSWTDK